MPSHNWHSNQPKLILSVSHKSNTMRMGRSKHGPGPAIIIAIPFIMAIALGDAIYNKIKNFTTRRPWASPAKAQETIWVEE